jgi:hypothetical protein
MTGPGVPPQVMQPRFLSRKLAAAWAGVSVATWDQEVAAGKWPAGEPRGAKGGKLTWDIKKLEARADGSPGPGGPVDDYEVARAKAAARRQRDAGQAKGRR